ncbi:MAG: hypothetical protein LBS63_04725 [Prevotellaceae bacterium]|nr:hypothetical protein [Prevotellaceae bacterium]
MKTHFKFLVGLTVALSAFSAAVMLLWNALVPSIFGFAAIGFWQALGLLFLARILFGGMGGGRRLPMMVGDFFGRNPIHDKWMKMTPEEREVFIHNRHRGHHHHRRHDFGGEFGHDFFSAGEPDKKEEHA